MKRLLSKPAILSFSTHVTMVEFAQPSTIPSSFQLGHNSNPWISVSSCMMSIPASVIVPGMVKHFDLPLTNEEQVPMYMKWVQNLTIVIMNGIELIF